MIPKRVHKSAKWCRIPEDYCLYRVGHSWHCFIRKLSSQTLFVLHVLIIRIARKGLISMTKLSLWSGYTASCTQFVAFMYFASVIFRLLEHARYILVFVLVVSLALQASCSRWYPPRVHICGILLLQARCLDNSECYYRKLQHVFMAFFSAKVLPKKILHPERATTISSDSLSVCFRWRKYRQSDRNTRIACSEYNPPNRCSARVQPVFPTRRHNAWC